jgi:hypothetical protein
MKISSSTCAKLLSRAIYPLIAAVLLAATGARAGLQMDMHLYGSYFCFPWISTNATTPSPTNTAYFVWSPTSTINTGIHFQLNPDNSIGGSGSSVISDYQAFIHEITNGNWTLLMTNTVSTNQYTFKVTVPSTITSNLFAPVIITSPTNGQINVTNTPTFTWTGPAGWGGALTVYDDSVDNNGNQTYVTSASLTPNQTSWPCPVTLPNGTNNFSANYTSNATAIVLVSTPVDSLSHPFPGFSFISTLETDGGQEFFVSTPAGPSTFGHTNIAHYTFDNSSNLGHDSSGNGNDMSGETFWGPQHVFDTDAEAGGGAVQFFGTDAMTAGEPALDNLNRVLAGSFTFSAWVKTTVTNGADYNNAFYGAVIFWAYNDQGNTNDTIPLAITGSKAAFTTRGGDSGSSDNLHSLTSVNDGNYHLITVTRDQSTGEKKIYVDGNFETSQIGTTNPLNGNNYNLTIGGWAYLLEMNSTVTNYSSYKGLLDDVQIYSGTLSDAEVASLYANPGTTIPDVAGSGTGGLVVHYDFDEGTVLAPDVSGNNNNIVYAGNFGGSGPSISPNAAAGAGSVSFDGGSYLTASSNLLGTLAGEFTVSLWLKTSQSFGNQGDLAWQGAGVIAADSPNAGAKDLIPVALTGGQVAFNVGDGVSDNTLNSSTTVNDDTWHHVVVTRSLSTGARQIFIDGALDSSDVASTVLLDSPVLLTIGAKSDASNPNPASPSQNGSNGYEGLLDDVQIYNRVLSSDEVAFLYQNPGATVTSSSSTPYPVDVSLQFSFIRSQDPNYGEIYGAGVSFSSVSPDPTTTNSVHSPNDYFVTETYPGGGWGSGAILSSLDQVINEFTNGLWKIYINQGSPTQQVYSFQVSISGLDTNVLRAVKIFSPTNGAVDVRANVPFYWNGPTNFSSLSLDLAGVVNVLSLPVTATNWAAAPTLSNGNQFFDLNYVSNNFPGVTFTTPVDVSSNPVRTWSATVNLSSEAFSLFFVGPNPTQLINAQHAGTNFQFSFLSQTGVTNSVQYRTNLVLGNWLTYSNITGDGSLKTIPIPVSVFKGAKQGFIRISSQ